MADGKPDLEIVEARPSEIRRPRATLLTLPSSPARTEARAGVEGILPEQQNSVGKEPPAGNATFAARLAGVLL